MYALLDSGSDCTLVTRDLANQLQLKGGKFDLQLEGDVMQGPDLMQSLVDVLLRFRQDSIAFTCDIREMFYQVKIPPEDYTVSFAAKLPLEAAPSTHQHHW